jgi:hypothetical protein
VKARPVKVSDGRRGVGGRDDGPRDGGRISLYFNIRYIYFNIRYR